jgi:hypothetical protein
MTRSHPLTLRRPSGIKVRDLIKLLETANPDSVVVFDDYTMGGYGVIRKAALDVEGCGTNSRPVVKLNT